MDLLKLTYLVRLAAVKLLALLSYLRIAGLETCILIDWKRRRRAHEAYIDCLIEGLEHEVVCFTHGVELEVILLRVLILVFHLIKGPCTKICDLKAELEFSLLVLNWKLNCVS